MVALSAKLFQQYCAMNPKKGVASEDISKVEHTMDWASRYIGQECKKPFLLMRHVNARAFISNPTKHGIAWNRNIYDTSNRIVGHGIRQSLQHDDRLGRVKSNDLNANTVAAVNNVIGRRGFPTISSFFRAQARANHL